MKTYTRAPHAGAFCVVLAIAMAGSCVFAQTETKDKQKPATPPPSAVQKTAADTELPPVTVSAHEGIAVPYDRTGVSVTILDSGQLQKEGYLELGNALKRVPGIYGQPGSGNYQSGNVDNLAIRGMSDPNYTLAMVDGMRLYRPNLLNPTANFLGQSMLFTLGNTEVVKGPQGASYGGGAVGGVIATETPAGEGKPSVKIFNEVGSYDSYAGQAVAQGTQGKWDYFVAAGYNRTNNDITYAPGYANPKHAGKFTQWEEAVRLGYRISDDTRINVTYRRQDAERNMSDPGGNTKYTYQTNLATIKLESKINKLWATSLMAGYYGWDPTFGGDPTAWLIDTHINLRNVQIEWRNALHWNEANTTTAGLAWNRSEYRSEYENRNLENVYGFFAEHLYKPFKNWDNSLALRLDHSTTWNNLFTYRYATSWKVTGEKSKTRLFGSFGSGYRSPTQFERYAGYTSPNGAVYQGNPDLKVSKSLSGDLGVEQRVAEGHFASLTGFWTRVNDEINVRYGSPTTYENIAHATSVGLECSLHGNFCDAWKTGYTVAYTYTVPKTNEDKQLSNTARSVWSIDLHTSPVESVITGLGIVAANGRTIEEGVRTDNYCVARWYAQWQATKNLAFHIRVENLLNDRYCTGRNYGSYPPYGVYDSVSMGTAVYGGFTLTF